MAPRNTGADRSLGRSPTYRTPAGGILQCQTVAGLCNAQPQCEHLRYVRPALNLGYGATSRLIYLGETNGLESSEDCRSTGGHGNQHVRLRSAQIDRIEAICPAPQASNSFASSRGRRPSPPDVRTAASILPRGAVFEGLGTHVGTHQPTSSEVRVFSTPAFRRPLYRKSRARRPRPQSWQDRRRCLTLGRCQAGFDGIKRFKT
jgi:hypothetical protein